MPWFAGHLGKASGPRPECVESFRTRGIPGRRRTPGWDEVGEGLPVTGDRHYDAGPPGASTARHSAAEEARVPDTDGQAGAPVDDPTPETPTAADAAAPAQEAAASTGELVPGDHGATADPAPLDTPVPWPWIGIAVALFVAALAARLATVGRRRRPVDDGLTASDAEPLPSDHDSDPSDASAAPPTSGLAARLQDRLERTRSAFRAGLDALMGRDTIDEAALEGLEDALLLADVGVGTAEHLTGAIRARLGGQQADVEVLRATLREEMLALLQGVEASRPVPRPVDDGPFVLLVVGVNGSGKTTTIGKLASRWTKAGHGVILGAADTFRAAAGDQLAVWAERAGCPIVQHPEGADPAAVAFETMDRAGADGRDLVLIDTAGRLQNARPLMEQLTKIRKVLHKKAEGAPHETWLVIDGTMGQNALQQARAFHDATPLTGVVVTKLDGTAKGGMVLAIAKELGLPVRFIGVGEQPDDLRPFDATAFVDALV